jgi:hypothetical protein
MPVDAEAGQRVYRFYTKRTAKRASRNTSAQRPSSNGGYRQQTSPTDVEVILQRVSGRGDPAALSFIERAIGAPPSAE